MKKFSTSLVLLAFVMLIISQGFAQNTPSTTAPDDPQKAQTTTAVTTCKFTDSNNNGICDNYEARGKTGHGANFVDKNGDGICDNCQGPGNGKCNPGCCGQGYKHQHGCGQGPVNCCGRGPCHGKGRGFQHRNGWENQDNPQPAPEQK